MTLPFLLLLNVLLILGALLHFCVASLAQRCQTYNPGRARKSTFRKSGDEACGVTTCLVTSVTEMWSEQVTGRRLLPSQGREQGDQAPGDQDNVRSENSGVGGGQKSGGRGGPHRPLSSSSASFDSSASSYLSPEVCWRAEGSRALLR